MIAVKLNDQFLDLAPSTSFTFNFNNAAIAKGAKVDITPTSFSLPVNIALTLKNRGILDYPDLIDTTALFIKDADCLIYFNDTFLFKAQATIKGSGRGIARLYLIVNPAIALKDFKLTDITFPTVNITSPSPTGHAKATTTAPLDQGYIFFPIYNPKFFSGSDDAPGTAKSNYQNYWDPNTQTFDDSTDQQNAMPFIRLAYLLEQAFAEIGVPLRDEWLTTDELKMLCVYNNHSIYDNDTWPTTINLKNHVPPENANDFINQILRVFAIGQFHDPFDHTASIIPMRDVIAAAPKHNWTGKASYPYEKTESTDVYTEFCHEVDSSDELADQFKAKPMQPTVATVNQSSELAVPPYSLMNGVFHFLYENSFTLQAGAPGSPARTFITKYFEELDTGLDGEKYTNKLAPLFMAAHDDITELGFPDDARDTPMIFQRGTHAPYEMNNKYKARLIFYRGMQAPSSGSNYPLANNQSHMSYGAVSFDNSLLWQGDNDIYTTWIRPLMNLLKYGKLVKRDLYLTLADFLNFRLQDKVRIGNQNYLVKQLRITFKGDSFSTKATMITTI